MVGWGYAKANGPATWSGMYPVAAGKRQSPIDIKTGACQGNCGLAKIQAVYSGTQVSELSNTGSSWKAQISGGSSSLKNGPLGGDEYVLEQFHCHWGNSNDHGSEHTVEGKCYAAELHLVHWNKTKFRSFAEAAASDGGLAVLGMFITVGAEHSEMNKIAKMLPFIKHKGQAITITDPVNPAEFIPKSGTYWTYAGSLTTPPCYESVTWIVYKQPIQMSQAQMDAFRSMKSYHPCESCPQDELAGALVENYRPPCALHDRVIRVFKDDGEEE